MNLKVKQVYLLQADGWTIRCGKHAHKHQGRTRIKLAPKETNDDQDMLRVFVLNKKFRQLANAYHVDPKKAYQVKEYRGVRGGFRSFGYTDDELVAMSKEKLEARVAVEPAEIKMLTDNKLSQTKDERRKR